MSDSEERPSTSKNTRRSGANTPRNPGAKQESRDSQSSEPSRASRTPLNYASREQLSLQTPTYGGNLFTGPSARKREAKKNSRFSPPYEGDKKKQTSASDKLAEFAAAFEDDDKPMIPTKKPTANAVAPKKKAGIANLKDTIGVLQSMPKIEFGLPSGFGGKSAELYRKTPGAFTSDKRRHSMISTRPRDNNQPPPLSAASSSASSSSDGPIAAFDFGDGLPSTSAAVAASVKQPVKRGRSMTDGRLKAVVKKEPADEEEEEDHPPRGRKKKEEEQRDGKQETRGRPKQVKVKEEAMSEGEEMPVISPQVQTPGRGRKSNGGGSLPPRSAASTISTIVGGRRKSVRGGGGAVVKEEPADDGYEHQQQPAVGGASAKRAETGGALRGIIKTEEEADEAAARARASRNKPPPAADQPSTSAAAEPDRSASQKRPRGRPTFAYLALQAAAAKKAAAAGEGTTTDEIEEPAAKRKDTRRSGRSTASEGGMVVKEEQVSPTKPPPPTRRSSRGSGAGAATPTPTTPTMTSASRGVPRGTSSSRGRGRGRGRGSRGGRGRGGMTGTPRAVASPSALVKQEAHSDDEEMETEEGEEEATKKPSTSATPAMLVDDSPARGSGYGGDPNLAYDTESADEGGEEKQQEEQASTSAAGATAAPPAPAKKGRGRPRIYFDRPKQPYPYVSVAKRKEMERQAALERGEVVQEDGGVPQQKDEQEQPIGRLNRRQTAPSAKLVEFLTDTATKSSRRKSAGAGMVPPTTPRSLAAAGLSLDLPSPRVRPTTPPPPEVIAAPGSALSIMRALAKNKKPLPSIRSPSPTPVAGRRSSMRGRTSSMDTLAAATATLADAPRIDRVDETEKKEEEEKVEEEKLDAPGPSRPSPAVARRSRESAKETEVEKEEEAVEKVEEEKEEEVEKEEVEPEKEKQEATDNVRLVDYSSSDEEKEASSPPAPTPPPPAPPAAPEPLVWITPDNIRITTGPKKIVRPPVVQKPIAVKPADTPASPDGEGKKEEETEPKEDESKAEGTPSESAAKKEETAQDLLAKWTTQRAEAGLPVVPPSVEDELAAAPVAPRVTRRSINAPARFGDYDLNYGDARKRSATIATPSTQPLSPVVPVTTKRPRKKKEETPSTPSTIPTVDEEAEEDREQLPGSAEKKKEKRPPIVLKLKLGLKRGGKQIRADDEGPEREQEEESEDEVEESEEGDGEEPEEPMEDDEYGEAEGDISVPSAPIAKSSVTPAARKKDRKERRGRARPKGFVPRWKRPHMPHLGYVMLSDKRVESVTLSCAGAIDDMLMQVCGDGIKKSTLSAREASSEHSRLSVAKRRAAGIIRPPAAPPVPGTPRIRNMPLPVTPREERTKRIRHAPQSKEYDNMVASLTAPAEPVTNSFQALAGLTDRRPSDRRKESRQDAAHKKESVVAAEKAAVKEADVLAPLQTAVEKPPKKERKRDREREKEKEDVVNKNAISYGELLLQKAYNAERLPGRVIADPADFFYREIFTDDLGDGIIEDTKSLDVDVIAFTEPRPDDLTSIMPIGAQAEDAAAKLLAVFPRPQPYPDEDDGLEEDQEWMDGDMKRALAHHSPARLDLVERALEVINSQRMADLAVQGTKGEQDVLYNSHLKHAYRLRELLPVFSEFRLGESTWLHRAFIRLLPAHLLPVYLETLRFLRYIDSKLAAALSKSLGERGIDAEWDDSFAKEQTDDDRTEPMLQGGPSATASSHSVIGGVEDTVPSDDVTATMEAVLKALEKAQEEASAAIPDIPDIPASPDDSDNGGLMIDEGTEEEETAAAAEQDGAATVPPTAVATAAAGDDRAAQDVVMADETPTDPMVDGAVEKKEAEESSKPELHSVCSILAEVTDKKVKEAANADTINNSINARELADVIPILVAPVFDIQDAPDDFVVKNRPYEYIYRLIRYATPTPSEFKTIKPRIPQGQCSIAEAMDAAVDCVALAVKAALSQRSKNKGKERVILFGWGLSCYINHRVSQLIHGISAIIDFAFPLRSGDGWRGGADDDICLTYCPTLFVMGAEAEDFDATELLMMRQNMCQPSGALIVGSTDAQLNISILRLSRERITQKIAVRMILEQVVEFINHPKNQLERAKLVPIQLNNIYAVEPSAVKSFSAQEAQQALVTGGQPRRTVPLTPADILVAGMGQVNQTAERRRMQQIEENKKRKRSRIEEQTTVVGRMASAIAASAAPITKRSRTDDLPSTSYGGRVGGDSYRFSIPGPSPLASPLASNSPNFRLMSRPAILSHSHHHHTHGSYAPTLPSPIIGGPSTASSSGASGGAGAPSSSSSSGLLLQAASTTRTANVAAPSPRGPLDPASISLS